MSAAMPLQPEQTLAQRRFVLIKGLGCGGMGEVWLARDERLREPVALKFLPPEIRGDPGALDDLRRETARSHKLSHPNIVRIHDLHEDADGMAFIVMEYIDGPTLAAFRLQQPSRTLSWGYLRPLAAQLCAALEYAHNEKVIHRDLKPANIMVDSRGRAKLADFGIAAAASESMSRVSVKYSTSGTLLYMSPQQLTGKRPQATDDIYALGATLYELLTGKPPFYTGDVTHQVLHQEPEPMDHRLAALGTRNQIPGDVAALVMACLSKEPEQRPQSARAVAEWIGLEVAPESSPKPSAPDVLSATRRLVTPEVKSAAPASGSSRKKRLWAIGVFAALLLLALGGWYRAKQAPQKNFNASQGQTGPSPGPPPPPSPPAKGQPGGTQKEITKDALPTPATPPDKAQPASQSIAPAFQLQRPSLQGRPSGNVLIWGKGSGNRAPAVAPAAMGQVVAISGGGFHSLALTGEGKVWAWGAGTVNTGTDPDFGQSMVPPELDHVVAISAGWQFSLALRQDGRVVGWGRNDHGQTDPPADLTNAVAIAAGASHAVALTSDGLVRMWGFSAEDWAGIPPDLNHVDAIASGWYHVLALRRDGTVAAWGAGATNSGKYPMFGQAMVPAGLNNVIAIAAGGVHSVALKADGNVVVWGGDSPAVRAVPPMAGVVAIAANGRVTLALLPDGTVAAWGTNSADQDQVPPGLNHVIAIAAGNNQSLALTNSP